MKKFRKWLIDRFLPRWAYESLLEELAAANKKQEELRQTVERQQCYISGLEYALRHMTPTVVVESHEKGAKENASLAAANSNNTTGNRNWNGSAGVADLSITPYIIYCTV